MCSDLVNDLSAPPLAIQINDVSKRYAIYDHPSARLEQFLRSMIHRLTGWALNPKYREFHALQPISLKITQGETIGIIGSNGSGKSTLLQLICGTLTPTSGHIEIRGRVAALLELGSGFNPDFTGRENIMLNASVLGLSREQIEARFDSIVNFADIGEFIEQPVKIYSSGMALRLAFAVIANVDADILVIDEALAVGDSYFTQKCMRFLRDFMKHGTVVFVSHDIEAVKALCPRVIWLNKGYLIQEGPTKEVCQAYLDAHFNKIQGPSALPHQKRTIPIQISDPINLPIRDPRLDFISASTLRNDIEVLNFDPDSAAVGIGGATICNVRLFDMHGQQLSWVIGGELVELKIEVDCQVALTSPVIGFMVKDRLGQALFGDNTRLSFADRPVATRLDQALIASFWFEMPRLPSGDYSTVVAVSDGTQNDHVVLHWVHDGLHFKSLCSSVCSGLIGIPMREIKLYQDGSSVLTAT